MIYSLSRRGNGIGQLASQLFLVSEEPTVTFAPKRDVAPLLALLSYVAAGLFANNIAIAGSRVKTQPTVPQIATPTKDPSAVVGSRAGSSEGSKSLAQVRTTSYSTAVFIENLGQFDSKVRYQMKIGGQTAWLTTDGVVFDAIRPRDSENVAATSIRGGLADPSGPLSPSVAPERREPPSRMVDRLVFTEDFVKANCCSKVEAIGQREGIYNYFQGQDPAEWRTNVRSFNEVVYRDVWPGIDLRLYGNGANLEQEFVVQPGGDLDRIQISYRGIENIGISRDGSLEVDTAFGKLRESQPRIYQQIANKRVIVDGHFKLISGNSYAFQVGAHRPEYPLIIDPTLLYSTFLGGSAGLSYNNVTERANGVAVDASGNAYVGGYTASPDFPTTPGSFQTSPPGSGFITKLNATGSALIYSTYVGSCCVGTSFAPVSVSAITVDAAGQAYVTGVTGAGASFPTTSNAYWPTDKLHSCTSDFFVAALNPTGTRLVYSTCLGIDSGTANGVAYGYYPRAIAADSSGHVSIVGGAKSYIPTTANAYQASYPGGGSAVFVSVFDTKGSGTSSLVYSTYLGSSVHSGVLGDPGPVGYGIAVDSYGKVYITGYAYHDFPVTPGAFQTSHSPANVTDAFVAKVDPSASGAGSLVYSTYLGGLPGCSGGCPGSIGTAIAVDDSGSAYVTGTPSAGSFPITTGAIQTSVGGVFVSKLNAGGSQLTYSTYLGTNDSSSGIAVDSLGNAYIVGSIRALYGVLPVTSDAFESAAIAKSSDYSSAFLAELDPTGSAVVYASFLGGSLTDVATGVAIDQTGDAYVTGYTQSFDFPATSSAFQTTLNPHPLISECPDLIGSGCRGLDAFVAKFPLGLSQTLSVSSLWPTSGGNSGTVSPAVVGTGFHGGATARLNCSGQSAIVGTNPTVEARGRLLTTTFDLAGKQPSKCDIVVTNPDGTSATLSQAFTVQKGGASSIQITLSGVAARQAPPETAFSLSKAAFFVTAQNTGNVDAPGVLVAAALSSGFSLAGVQPPGLDSVPNMAAAGVASWSIPNLAPGQSTVLTYLGTTAPAAAFSPVPIGPVWGLPGLPPKIPLPPAPAFPLPTGAPYPTVAEVLSCIEDNVQGGENDGGNCMEAGAEVRAGSGCLRLRPHEQRMRLRLGRVSGSCTQVRPYGEVRAYWHPPQRPQRRLSANQQYLHRRWW